MEEPIGLRTYWQKFASLKPENIRTCLAKHINQVFMYGLQLKDDWHLTKEWLWNCKRIYWKNIHNTVVNKYCIFKVSNPFFFWLSTLFPQGRTWTKLPKTTPKYKKLFCQTSKNVSSYPRVFTLYSKSVDVNLCLKSTHNFQRADCSFVYP